MPAITESRVVLPQPEGPTIMRHLAGVDVPVDLPEGGHPLLAGAEVLGDPADLDGDRRRPAAAGPSRPCSPDLAAVIDRPPPIVEGIGRSADRRPADQPRKTTAGSSTITLRMLSRLARMQIRTTAPPVIGRSCQGV